MGLEDLKDEIISNANNEVQKIKEQTNIEIKKILDETKQKIDSFKKIADDEIKKSVKDIQSKGKSSVALHLKKIELEMKKKLIDEAFEKAKKRINDFPQDKRKTILKKLLEKAEKEINPKMLYCSESDIKLISGYKIQKKDIIGGLIAESEGGLIRIDYSFENLLGGIREKHLEDIAKIMFQN